MPDEKSPGLAACEPITLDMVWDATPGILGWPGEDDGQREVTMVFTESRWPWLTERVPAFMFDWLPRWMFRERTATFPADVTVVDGVEGGFEMNLKPTGTVAWAGDGGEPMEPQKWCGDPSCCPEEDFDE